MKKKLLFLLLALSLMTTMVACNNKKDEDSNSETVAGETQGQAEGEDQDEEHEHGAYEWIGEFELKKGEYLLHFGASPDETLDIGFIKLGDNVTDLEHHASHLMVIEDKEIVEQAGQFQAKPDFAYTLEMDPEHGHINFEIAEDGTYAIVTEHYPSESQMQIFDSKDVEILPVKEHEGTGEHSH